MRRISLSEQEMASPTNSANLIQELRNRAAREDGAAGLGYRREYPHSRERSLKK